MTRADRVTGVVALTLGVAGAVGARRLPAEAEFGLGAAFLPFWLGVLLAVLSLGLLFQAGKRFADEKTASRPADLPAWGRLLGTLALLAAYVALLERLGYVAATFLFLLFSMMVLERGRWWITALVSGLSTGALVAIFRVWLKAPLPRGLLGF